ncbi:MAG: BamA/TamA family outer membrane protein [Muribaculaceae bacterium]|nr:BamA/TamA family outer membrane protein [Muribaculaceae bacterium]
MKFKATHILATAATAISLWACSSVKHVPDGQYLLDKVEISVDSPDEIATDDLQYFLRQSPNHKVLGFARLQLAAYSLSGSDSTRWYNRWLRRIGQAPVIFDSVLTEASGRQLRTAMVNRGYMDASVDIDTFKTGNKRIGIKYLIHTGRPHFISSMAYDIPDTAVRRLIMADSSKFSISPGSIFDRNRLDELRAGITEELRNNGYYDFNKDYIKFLADTAADSKAIDLTLQLHHPKMAGSPAEDTEADHRRYDIRRVVFVTNYDPKLGGEFARTHAVDSVDYKGITVLYGRDRYLKPQALEEKCYIRPGHPYDAEDVDRTYAALSQLGIAKFINIEMQPVAVVDGVTWMDAYVLMSRNRKQGISVEVDGTNSEGDLGFGVGITYQHRDLARGSELLTAKVRTSYEALSGNFEGLVNNRYTEYAGEVGISFPKFMAPFLRRSFTRHIRANTEFAVSFNYQERPEYTRIIAGAAWKYIWTQNRQNFNSRQNFDFIDINYVRLPRSTINFLDSVAPSNPLLRYSYEDHFIMRMGYTYYRTNRRTPTATVNAFAIQPSVTTLRASVEVAGNLLYAISNIFGQQRKDGAYKIFGIQYAQYVKGEADYTYTRNFNSRNALAFHVGAGIAYPYGNSSMVPFEKRFYAGGANGVRGWGVRTLGPGAYDSKNSVTDFINQCGDIRLDLSLEYRAKLFWVFEGALFVDAGNIWTIKSYVNQPGGEFRFNKFYKQIAAAYGVGIRMDFTYFLLRFDLGLKAHNPAMNQEPWPIIHPKWSRDANFHFSVGYPF